MTQLKDYYHILEIPPTATQKEVKQSFRKLAVQYHPDKNPGNVHADSHFKEIQEAYSVLSNTHRRSKYDEVRWLSGMGNKVRQETKITPQWILQESIKLRNHMEKVDTYRMSHRALHDFVMLLLSKQHLSILSTHNETETNKKIVEEILQATAKLQAKYMVEVAHQLEKITFDPELLSVIKIRLQKQRKNEKRDKWLPWTIVIAAILLCLIMFFYGKK